MYDYKQISSGLKRRAGKFFARIAHSIFIRARETEIRNSQLYLPCHYFETADTMRKSSTVEKYDEVLTCITHNLGDPSAASILDLGCNDGYFALRLATEGFWVTGIDSSPHYINIAKFLQERYSVDRAAFYEVLTDQQNIRGLPTFDVVIFMSVFQKWCSQYGYSNAIEMLRILWGKSKRMMFFEMPDSLETDESFKNILPDMGETKQECRDFIAKMLSRLDSCSVRWLGDHNMDYREEERSLFLLTRVEPI